MSLRERLSELVHACFTGLWIESHEHDDALAEMAQLCQAENWRLAAWDVAQGLQLFSAQPTVDTGTNDPLAAIRSLAAFPPSDQPTLLVLVNFHRFLPSAEIVQALARQITLGKQNRTFLVILSPVIQVPTELEKQFQIVTHELPSIFAIADRVVVLDAKVQTVVAIGDPARLRDSSPNAWVRSFFNREAPGAPPPTPTRSPD